MTTRTRRARAAEWAAGSAVVVFAAAALGACSGTVPSGSGSASGSGSGSGSGASGAAGALGEGAGATRPPEDGRTGSVSGPIVLRVPIDAVLKEDYSTLAELGASRSVDVVVAGDVTRASPSYRQQVPGTELTVRVTRSNNQAVRSGSIVTVLRDGGLIPLAQVLPDLNPRVKAQLPASPPAGAVVDFVFLGAAQSVAGDRIVAFLHRDPHRGREGTYQLVSSVRGLLRFDGAAGRYERLGMEAASGVPAFIDRASAEAFARPSG